MDNILIKKAINKTPNFIKDFFKKNKQINKISSTIKQVDENNKKFMAQKNKIETEQKFKWPFKE